MSDSHDTTPRKAWWKNWKILVPALVAVTLFGTIGSNLDDADEPQAKAAKERVEPAAESVNDVSKKSESGATSAEVVWARVMVNYPDGMGIDNPLRAVYHVEDISPGDIRVFVQEHLSSDERVKTARFVFNMGALDDSTVETVVIRDASGDDSNHYRHDFPYLK